MPRKDMGKLKDYERLKAKGKMPCHILEFQLWHFSKMHFVKAAGSREAGGLLGASLMINMVEAFVPGRCQHQP